MKCERARAYVSWQGDKRSWRINVFFGFFFFLLYEAWPSQ